MIFFGEGTIYPHFGCIWGITGTRTRHLYLHCNYQIGKKVRPLANNVAVLLKDNHKQ